MADETRVTPPTPGQAAYEKWALPGESIWDEFDEVDKEFWEGIGRAAIAAYIEANGRDPVDAASVIAEVVAPELAKLREVIDQFTRHTVWPASEVRKVNGWRETAGLPPLEAAP